MSRGSRYTNQESFDYTMQAGIAVLQYALLVVCVVIISPIMVPIWILGKIKIAYDNRNKD